MGIYDRDYMKRPPDRGGGRPLSGEEKLDRILGGFVGKHRRWLVGLGLVIAALILIGLLWAVLAA